MLGKAKIADKNIYLNRQRGHIADKKQKSKHSSHSKIHLMVKKNKSLKKFLEGASQLDYEKPKKLTLKLDSHKVKTKAFPQTTKSMSNNSIQNQYFVQSLHNDYQNITPVESRMLFSKKQSNVSKAYNPIDYNWRRSLSKSNSKSSLPDLNLKLENRTKKQVKAIKILPSEYFISKKEKSPKLSIKREDGIMKSTKQRPKSLQMFKFFSNNQSLKEISNNNSKEIEPSQTRNLLFTFGL